MCLMHMKSSVIRELMHNNMNELQEFRYLIFRGTLAFLFLAILPSAAMGNAATPVATESSDSISYDTLTIGDLLGWENEYPDSVQIVGFQDWFTNRPKFRMGADDPIMYMMWDEPIDLSRFPNVMLRDRQEIVDFCWMLNKSRHLSNDSLVCSDFFEKIVGRKTKYLATEFNAFITSVVIVFSHGQSQPAILWQGFLFGHKPLLQVINVYGNKFVVPEEYIEMLYTVNHQRPYRGIFF